MKVFPLFLPLLLFFQLSYGQSGAECSANAGVDQTICQTQGKFTLSAPNSADYNDPPNPLWTYVSGPAVPADLTISPDNALTASVSHNGPLPPGDYVFELCVDCADINLDGQNDRPCDQVTVTVAAPVTVASITENDGAEDGSVEACYGHTFQLSTPATGESWAISISPQDEDVSYAFDPATGVLQVSLAQNQQPLCGGYTVTYTISNGGCSSTAMVDLFIVGTFTDDLGNAFATASPCPNCGNRVNLDGSYPGCDASGVWTVVSSPPGSNLTLVALNTFQGDASYVVDMPGEYTFEYTVSGNGPCPALDPVQVSCTFLQAADFELGGNETLHICGESFPAGSYPLSVPAFDETIYEWDIFSVSPPGAAGNLSLSSPNSPTTDLVISQDIVGENIGFTVRVTATRYYLDPDCEGPEPVEVIPLPDPLTEESLKKFLEEIDLLASDTTVCLYICTDAKDFFSGARRRSPCRPIRSLSSAATDPRRSASVIISTSRPTSRKPFLRTPCSKPPARTCLPAWVFSLITASRKATTSLR